MRRPVVLHDGRMVNRDVGGAALEIGHRVAALQHQLTDQPVRLGDGSGGVVDEMALQHVPRVTEPCRLGRAQRRDDEVLDALSSAA